MAINPFVQPINYSTQFVDLNPAFRAAGEGFRAIGEGIQEQAKQEQVMTLKAQYATDLQNALKNPTQETWSQMIAKYPQQREAFAEARKGFGETALANEFNQGFQVSTALENKRPEIAKERLQTFITARKNSNLPTGIYEDALQALERDDVIGAQASVNAALALADPDRFQKQIKARLEASTAPSISREAAAKAEQAVTEAQTKVADLRIKLQNEPIEAERLIIKRDLELAQANEAKVKEKYAEQQQLATLEKSNWDVKNLKSQISDRSAQLNLKTQEVAATVAEKLASVGQKLNEVPADTKKLINESAVAAATSKQSAGQFNDLAKRLEAEGGGYGVFSSASDYLKRGVGFQGGMTQLRQEYTRLRNTAAIKSLPPGPATDKDIALALRGFPSETASASDLSSFLRGMAKLQDIDASINNAKTDWLTNNNGSLARAKTTFVAGDYAAKAGENFNDFSSRIIDDVTKKYDPRTQTPLVEQIPTPRNPQPMAAQNNIRSAADAILSGGQ